MKFTHLHFFIILCSDAVLRSSDETQGRKAMCTRKWGLELWDEEMEDTVCLLYTSRCV